MYDNEKSVGGSLGKCTVLPKGQPTVNDALEEQSKCISSLHDLITQLENKVQLLIRQEPESDNCKEVCQPSPNSIRQIIQSNNGTVNLAGTRLNNLLHKLKLN